MERAIPGIKGRIDKWGYYTDVERPSRVALSVYGTHYTQADILDFIKKAKAAPDPYHYISRGGVPLPGTTLGGIYGTNTLGTNLYSGLTNRALSGVRTNTTNTVAPGAKQPKKP
jgi:hypothetical protein